MSAVKNFSYVDAAFEHMVDGEEQAPFWRAFHWGLFPDPENMDDDPDRYYAAGERMTEAIVTAAGVTDGARVLDVGCGFGGTLDHIAARNKGCRLAGINIDERQMRQARVLLESHGRALDSSTPFITADGCRLPVASGSLDHILAVECIFHFPSRKTFLKEAARVLKPGGTLALSDFVAAPRALHSIVTRVAQAGLGDDSWYGHQSKPPTSATYERLGRAVGLDLVRNDNVTADTMPTYPALKNIYMGAGFPEGAASVEGLEDLARSGDLGYHVIAFKKRAA
jgi:cyclopropane fatty-acyl-phospholipid synthase-like methyltransferase